LAALCDLNEERLHAFGNDFDVDKRYTDIHEMLDKEKPHLLHIVTPPTIRYSLMRIASDHAVPAAIVEKPIALQGEDYRDILGLCQASGTKFIVNTQLHFHPNNLRLKEDVAGGRIGDVRFVDGSARSTPVDQGPHVMELVSSYVQWAAPASVFGQVSGGRHLNSGQPSPDNATAAVTFADDVRAQVTFGVAAAPKSHDNDSVYMHKRVAAYGSAGWVHWYMAGWERFTRQNGYESGHHSYGEQDVLGQAGLTEAALDWVLDDDKPHPTRLERSLRDFNTILGLYVSALTRAPVSLPFDPPDGLLDSLRQTLTT
jgi:predicted dehydrogenase